VLDIGSTPSAVNISINSGSSWTSSSTLGPLICISGSIDEKYMATCGISTKIFISSNYGASWSNLNDSLSSNWKNITSSVSGQYLAACASSGYIYTSSNYGANWTQQTNGLPTAVSNWQTIKSSSDGSRLIAAINGGPVYIGVYS
jgi:photosystem II stability/assembly factor-like uncharacterized protein